MQELDLFASKEGMLRQQQPNFAMTHNASLVSQVACLLFRVWSIRNGPRLHGANEVLTEVLPCQVQLS
jgi:hypothetical protein